MNFVLHSMLGASASCQTLLLRARMTARDQWVPQCQQLCATVQQHALDVAKHYEGSPGVPNFPHKRHGGCTLMAMYRVLEMTEMYRTAEDRSCVSTGTSSQHPMCNRDDTNAFPAFPLLSARRSSFKWTLQRGRRRCAALAAAA